jgi:DNA-binding NarL/FixJ family response regulator
MVANIDWQSSATAAVGRGVTRILIVDSQPVVREGLRRILEDEPDLVVCAEAEGSIEGRNAIAAMHPDVVVTDISLREGDGIGMVRGIRAQYPDLPILVLSSFDESLYAERMLSIGANGYIAKHASSEHIIACLRRVLAGEICVSEAVGHNMIQRAATRKRRTSANPIERLSTRELQILQLVGKGFSTRESAHSLNLSIKTIESHRQRIKSKLSLRNGTQLVQFAVNMLLGESRGASLQS